MAVAAKQECLTSCQLVLIASVVRKAVVFLQGVPMAESVLQELFAVALEPSLSEVREKWEAVHDEILLFEML